MAKEQLSTIEFNTKSIAKRKKNLLDDLCAIDEPEVTTLPSDIILKHKKDKESKKELKKALKEEKKAEEFSDYDDDGWMATLTSFEAPITKKKTKSLFDGIGGKKKKKKKKGKAGEPVNYKKEFEPEMALLRNLQYEQDKFVSSLQKKYDQMESTKSTARGVGKFTTDLIMSITSARGLSRQLVGDIIAAKKNIADLDFKERKEFGSKLNGENDSAAYASNFLKQMMSVSRVDQSSDGGVDIEDIGDNTEDLFDSISESLGETDRSEDVKKYLQYENENPIIKVIYHEDKEDSDDLDELYDFVAYSESGKILDDYPKPAKTKLQINRNTGTCIDKYGNKYQIIFD